jgi:molecular chaperone GrpE
MTKSAKPKKDETNPERDELRQQVSLLTEALQRERADATTIRRQHEEQLNNLRTVIKASVIRDLLPVIDNFERALKHEPTTELPPEGAADYQQAVLEALKKYEDYVNGVRSLVKQFEKTMSRIGVERIKTVGEHFDPKYHEAVSMEEGDGTQEIVSEELQAGYQIGEDVIRHAMVRVQLTK